MTSKTNKAIQTLKDAGYLMDICWQKDDIRHKAEELEMELTAEQVNQVAELLIDGHDANLGLNWDIMEDAIIAIYNKGEGTPIK